ncbi:hypothetical protein ACFFRR_000764 [Megaselia abdita]
MSVKNLAVVIHRKNDMRLENRPIPEISSKEVLLRMDCVGICGSDISVLTKGRLGDYILKEPLITGHESSGVIIKVGSGVKNLVPGDRVAVEPGIPCRFCSLCKAGSYNICPDLYLCSIPPCNGNLTNYHKHAADFCHKLPPHVTMEEGALMEPLAVGVRACRRAGVTLGSQVLITGAGPVGLVTLLVAQAMGASNILITDLAENRLKTSKQLGAQNILVIDPNEKEENIVKKVREVMVPDITIDCCGYEATTRLAILATRSGGKVLVAGLASTDVKIPLVNALAREIDILGTFTYGVEDYPAALALIASGKIKNIKSLITHHFDIEEAPRAFETAQKGLNGAIKVMIHCQPRNSNNSTNF